MFTFYVDVHHVDANGTKQVTREVMEAEGEQYAREMLNVLHGHNVVTKYELIDVHYLRKP